MTDVETVPKFVRSDRITIPDCFIVDRGPDAALLIAVHGITRNAAEIAARLAGDRRLDGFTICAPLFEQRRFGQYQQLIARRGRVPADLALLDLFARLAAQGLTRQNQAALFGFSGGAQMVHRFALLHPDKVSRVCAVAAGWYLMPDRDLAYPYGLKDELRFCEVSDAYLDVPITIAVGTADARIDRSVRQEAVINAMQGRNRLVRAKRWVREMRQRAIAGGREPQTRFVAMRGGTHDFGQCVRSAGLLDIVAKTIALT